MPLESNAAAVEEISEAPKKEVKGSHLRDILFLMAQCFLHEMDIVFAKIPTRLSSHREISLVVPAITLLIMYDS